MTLVIINVWTSSVGAAADVGSAEAAAGAGSVEAAGAVSVEAAAGAGSVEAVSVETAGGVGDTQCRFPFTTASSSSSSYSLLPHIRF